LVPHDADWTYSLAIPPGDEWHALTAVASYRRIHEWIQCAFATLGVATKLASHSQKEVPGECFVGWEQHDVLWNERKVAGAAQRRNKLGLLIQGSVQPPPIGLDRRDWENALCQVAGAHWGKPPTPLPLSSEFLGVANRLAAEKYSKDEFNQRR
jgi:lipoate-protein ligase A